MGILRHLSAVAQLSLAAFLIVFFVHNLLERDGLGTRQRLGLKPTSITFVSDSRTEKTGEHSWTAKIGTASLTFSTRESLSGTPGKRFIDCQLRANEEVVLESVEIGVSTSADEHTLCASVDAVFPLSLSDHSELMKVVWLRSTRTYEFFDGAQYVYIPVVHGKVQTPATMDASNYRDTELAFALARTHSSRGGSLKMYSLSERTGSHLFGWLILMAFAGFLIVCACWLLFGRSWRRRAIKARDLR